MFETLQMAPPDPILGLTESFRQDPNPNKINLSVGVYKNEEGKTPILNCVKAAERRLVDSENTKSYLPMNGPPEYGTLVRGLLFGEDSPLVEGGRTATLQTPGGTGGLRVAADFLRSRLAVRRIWVSKPTWANHPGIFSAAGLEVETYPYLAADGIGLDFDAMLSGLKEIPQGDAVCLHACCHNPTGIDPTTAQWREIADVIIDRGLMPLVDFAYQGLGDGLREDAGGLAELCSRVEEMLICSSFSKNFGLYSERIGALTMVGASESATAAAFSHAKLCVRTNYSNPPQHGGAIVQTVLSDPELRSQWEQELAAMRERINGMRKQFAEMMKARNVSHDFSFITQQRGMFSFSGLTPLQVDELRNEHSIYIVNSGRINVAGMTPHNLDRLGDAIAKVLSS
jgi:aspartate/tyrosine/aromatic aminotransferase